MRAVFGLSLVLAAWAGCVTISGFNTNVDGVYKTTADQVRSKPVWKKDGANVYISKFHDGVWSISSYKNPGAHQRMAFVNKAPDQGNSPTNGQIYSWGSYNQGIKVRVCECAAISGFSSTVDGNYRKTSDVTNSRPVFKKDGANVYLSKFWDGVWSVSSYKNPGGHQRMAFANKGDDQYNSPIGGTLYSWGSYNKGIKVTACSAATPSPTKKPTKKPTKAPTKKTVTTTCHRRETGCSYQPDYYNRGMHDWDINWNAFGFYSGQPNCLPGESLNNWRALPYQCHGGNQQLKLEYYCCGSYVQESVLTRLMRALGFKLH